MSDYSREASQNSALAFVLSPGHQPVESDTSPSLSPSWRPLHTEHETPSTIAVAKQQTRNGGATCPVTLIVLDRLRRPDMHRQGVFRTLFLQL